MEDKFHELALEKLAGRASAEESRKLEDYLGQDPALQAEYDRLELEVRAAKDLIPLLKESDADSEDLPEHEKNLLMAEVRSVFGAGDQQSEPTHEVDPQQEELDRWWWWVGGLGITTALVVFLLIPPSNTGKPGPDPGSVTKKAHTKALEVARKELEQNNAKIAKLESDLEKVLQQVGGLKANLGTYEVSIKATQKKLASAEGDRVFLMRELKRMQTEKDELVAQFNDLKGKDKSVPIKPVIAFAMRINDAARGGDGEPPESKAVLDNLFPGIQPKYFDDIDNLALWSKKWQGDDFKTPLVKIIYNKLIGTIQVTGKIKGKDFTGKKIADVTTENLESKLKEALKQISAWTKQ